MNIRYLLLMLFVTAACNTTDQTVAPSDNTTMDEILAKTEEMDGFYDLYRDQERNALYMMIDRWDEKFLYFTSLAEGVGSSSMWLDRGQIMNDYVGKFTRSGSRALLELQNPKFTNFDRDHTSLTQSVRESFPTSVVASFDIIAENDNGALIEVTDYFLQDEVGASDQLESAGSGNYRADSRKSSIVPEYTDAFPENAEIRAKVTFSSEESSSNLGNFAPDSRNITLQIHHSLVKLPDEGFEPREFDPRVGYFSVDRYDFSGNYDEGYIRRYATRHRLKKQNPEADVSEPVEPITYYLDPAIPEPYRQAFRDGIEWFEGLFENAGFENAFQLKDMPEDMNPMDARYNVVLWVHRNEAGASVGPSFRDPRTGEIIKATVRMDSHRSLINYNQFRSYAPSAAEGVKIGEWITSLDDDVDAEEFTMARRRQHAAHEVGHTLGLAHNFIAESYGRASVMDYPAPRLQLSDDGLDLSGAYSSSPGIYDTLAIQWGYKQFPEDSEDEGPEKIIREMTDRDIKFISHPYHGSSGSYPAASTWMLGEDVTEEFREALEIRQTLLEHFDRRVIDEGDPLWLMNERLNPAYFYHRYILSATIKHLGGYEFQYAMKGDGRDAGHIIESERVTQALTALMDATEPEQLALPDHIVEEMAPRPYGYSSHDRNINTDGGPVFDQLGPARVLTAMIYDGLLDPERAARTAALSQREPELPSLDEAIEYLINRSFVSESSREAFEEIRQRALTNALIDLAAKGDAPAEVRASAEYGLDLITEQLGEAPLAGRSPHHRKLERDIKRYFERGIVPERSGRAPAIPSGFPIGDAPEK